MFARDTSSLPKYIPKNCMKISQTVTELWGVRE